MQAFRLYGKLTVIHALPNLFMYLGVFLVITLLNFSAGSGAQTDTFNASVARTTVINRDVNGELSNNLEKYVNSNTRKIELSDDEEVLRDALFATKAEYIIIIPKGFSDAFLTDNQMQLEVLQAPNSSAGTAVSTLVTSFLKTSEMYLKSTGQINYDVIRADLAKTVDIEFNATIFEKKGSHNADSFFSIFMAYPLMASILSCLPIINFVMNEKEFKKRNLCSPISYTNYSAQIFLGNIILTIFIFLVFVLMGILLGGIDINQASFQLNLINGLLFSFAISSISFFLSLISGQTVVGALSTVLSLGLAFIGGVFVPQSLLSDSILKLSIINPAYWYVKTTETLLPLQHFDFTTTKEVYGGFIIQILFTFAFLSMSLVAIKKKRQS